MKQTTRTLDFLVSSVNASSMKLNLTRAEFSDFMQLDECWYPGKRWHFGRWHSLWPVNCMSAHGTRNEGLLATLSFENIAKLVPVLKCNHRPEPYATDQNCWHFFSSALNWLLVPESVTTQHRINITFANKHRFNPRIFEYLEFANLQT